MKMPDDTAGSRNAFAPIFGSGGNVAANHEDVENCYNLILGRHPENVAIVSEALRQPVHAIMRDMIACQEFAEVHAALLIGKVDRHLSLGKQPPESLLFWLNRTVVVDAGFSKAVLSAEEWGDLLHLLFAIPQFASLVKKTPAAAIALPTVTCTEPARMPSTEAFFVLDECSMTRVYGWAAYRSGGPAPVPAPVSLRVFVDGQPEATVDCNLPRPDLKAAGYPTRSGFKFQLPRGYFDGVRRTIHFEIDGTRALFQHLGEPKSEFHFSALWAPPLRSNVDGFDRGVIRGWALRGSADDDALKGGVTVKVTYHNETVATLKANRFRPDVGQALGADAYCGFVFEPPVQLRRSSALSFHFHDVSDDSELANSPCSTSFGHDHREGKLLALQDTLERLSAEVLNLKQDIKSLISTRHHTVAEYDPWFRDYLKTLQRRTSVARHNRQPVTQPLVSVICPTYRPDLADFKAAVTSVMVQTYPHWELIIIDDGSKDPALTAYVKALAAREPRVKPLHTSKNLRISGATNVGIDAARGEWIALLDHDDLLVDVALEVMVDHALMHGAKLLYSDEDKIDAQGYFSEPSFKPDWNYRFLLSCNYVCHLLLVRTELVRKVGKLRSTYDGAQDHDLMLRLSETLPDSAIAHVPEVLYHWRKGANSTATGISAKTYAVAAGVAAITDHLSRKGHAATVTSVLNSTMYAVQWASSATPVVQIIIPFRDQAAMTARCLDAVLKLTRYPNFKITLVDNWSNKPETRVMVDTYRTNPRIDYVSVEEEFNYSRLNNLAVGRMESEYVFFMNNDLVVSDPGWLDAVVNEAEANPSVAAVGGKFLYPNGTVQHAGVVLGLWGVAGHVNSGVAADAPGYAARAMLAQEVSAVTAAGMLVRRKVFRDVGQFDEVKLRVAFNDIDLCLKIRAAGYKIIWTPAFVAEHHESLSRGHDDKLLKRARFQDEIDHMQQRWSREISLDPYYSRFFDLFGEPFFDLVDPAELEGRDRRGPADRCFGR